MAMAESSWGYGDSSGGWGASDDGSGEGGFDYWVSYADLLAGLLMVFALMLLTALYYYQGRVTDVRDLLQTRQAIVDSLQQNLGRTEAVTVVIDSTSGSVRFSGEVLFNEDSDRLLPAGEKQLEAFAAKYLPVLLGVDRFRENLRAIVIEGHTNTHGPYLYNLDLSQRRANSVLRFLLDHAAGYRRALRQYVTANGRSYADPVVLSARPGCSADPYREVSSSCVDQVASRRIEIRFRLNNREVIQKIMERLFVET